MTVNDLIEDQDRFKSFEYSISLWPERWNSIIDLGDLNWEIVIFNEDNLSLIPEVPGIYSFVINSRITNHPHKYLGYIGKTIRTLRARYKEYLSELDNIKGRPKVVRLLNKWKGHIDFCYIRFPVGVDPEPIESRLNDAFMPPYNDDFSLDINKIVNAF